MGYAGDDSVKQTANSLPSSHTEDSFFKSNILKQLDLDKTTIDNIDWVLMAEAYLPYNPNVSVIIVPICKEKEDAYCIEYDAYILLVDHRINQITHKLYKKDLWKSDATDLRSLTIDFSLSAINKKHDGFGVIAYYVNTSAVCTGVEETISLFVPKGKKIIEVLDKFNISTDAYPGRWGNEDCSFFSRTSTLNVTDTKTKGFYDIDVVTEEKEYIYQATNDEEPNVKKSTTTHQILKYKNKKYAVE